MGIVAEVDMNQVYVSRLSDLWCRVLQTNGVPCDADLAAHFLAGLLDLLVASLTAEPFCTSIAQSVGVALAVATHAHAPAAPASVALLARELPLLLQHAGHPTSDQRLGALLDSFSTGFSDYAHVLPTYRHVGADPRAFAFDLLDSQLSRPDLSARDCQVLRALAVGQTNRAIGLALGLTEKAIERRVSVLCGKLGVSSRAALAAYAVRVGLA